MIILENSKFLAHKAEKKKEKKKKPKWHWLKHKVIDEVIKVQNRCPLQKKKKLNFNLGKSFFKKKNMVFTEWKEGT